MLNSPCKLASTVLIASLMVGCGGLGNVHMPRKPDTSIDVSKVPNAVPRHEPKGRYGNPRSYVVFGERYYPMDSAKGFVESGVASWYGPNFHGKKTSSQETYDMYQMTAAHKTLPIPCYLEVTNLKNGRSVIVRVNDRGPFHDDRILDLSFVAAKKLDIIKAGTGRVEIRTIDPANPEAHRYTSKSTSVAQPPRAPVSHRTAPVKQVPVQAAGKAVEARPPAPVIKTKQLYVQLGAYSDLANARKFKARIQQVVSRPVSIASQQIGERLLYKVRIGPMANTTVADRVKADLNAAGHYEHHVLFQ